MLIKIFNKIICGNRAKHWSTKRSISKQTLSCVVQKKGRNIIRNTLLFMRHVWRLAPFGKILHPLCPLCYLKQIMKKFQINKFLELRFTRLVRKWWNNYRIRKPCFHIFISARFLLLCWSSTKSGSYHQRDASALLLGFWCRQRTCSSDSSIFALIVIFSTDIFKSLH